MKPVTKKKYYPASPPVRPGFRSVLPALVLTLATFFLLPLFGFISPRRHDDPALRVVSDVTLIQAPKPVSPPAARMERPARPRQRPRPRSRPRLRSSPELKEVAKEVKPLDTRMILGMSSLAAGEGDFSLDFSVSAPSAPSVDETAFEEPLIFLPAQLDSPPSPLVRIPPHYPLRARQRGLEGSVNIEFVVRVDGEVDDISVIDSVPGDIFVQATINAVRRWRFTPGRFRGRPVASRVRQILRFELD